MQYKTKIYEPGPWEKFKMILHCVTHWHRQCCMTENGKLRWIACFDCNSKPGFDKTDFWR